MTNGNPLPTHNHVKSDLLRWILICIGWISIAGGIVGLLLPLVPTVPFLLLAALCFSRSSQRFHSWLVDHKHLGPLVRDYLTHGRIALRAKVMAIATIWISVPASTFLLIEIVWVRVLLMATATAVTLYLLVIPTVAPAGKAEETKQEL